MAESQPQSQSPSQSTSQSLFVVSASTATDPLAVTDTASSPCGTGYFVGCISTAIVQVCGDVNQTSCICGLSGQGAIASKVGPCLLAQCPITEILALGNFATSVCDVWLKTNTLTATGAELASGLGTTAIPTSTTFSSVTTSNLGDMSITSSPTLPTSSPTTSNTAAPAKNLSVGADVGIGIGALAIVAVIGALLLFFVRRRRSKRETSPEAFELQTEANVAELPDKSYGGEDTNVMEIPQQELQLFQFPFQKHDMEPVEADSYSVRAQSRGRVVGTETTAFDFESQKVLLTPDLKTKSRASSRAPESSAPSLRRHNTDT